MRPAGHLCSVTRMGAGCWVLVDFGWAWVIDGGLCGGLRCLCLQGEGYKGVTCYPPSSIRVGDKSPTLLNWLSERAGEYGGAEPNAKGAKGAQKWQKIQKKWFDFCCQDGGAGGSTFTLPFLRKACRVAAIPAQRLLLVPVIHAPTQPLITVIPAQAGIQCGF